MHARMDEDMMGFSDTIFPAFLFCMGMSVSFAIQNRYKKETIPCKSWPISSGGQWR